MMIALPLFSFVIALVFRTNFLLSILLFFGLPSLYLSIRNPRTITKTSIFSFLLSIPATFIFDYLLVRDNAWYIVSTIFPFRLFQVVVLEQFIFSFLWILFIITIYESFFDRKIPFQKKRLISKSMLIFGLTAVIAVFMLIGVIFINPQITIISYSYAFLGTVFFIIPLLLFLWYFPHLFRRFMAITIYFFLFSLLVEFAGLNLNYWIFPGSHYLWTIRYFGVRIPIEEVLFYFVVSTPGILAYYEYLDDDRK